MILRPEPVVAAIEALRRPGSLVILLDPVGEVFRQARAVDLATREHLIFVCPRYEGVDERIRAFVDLELSIGDYVLSGGEPAAAVVVDSVARLQPGALNDAESAAQDSFEDGLLDCPHFTKPVGHPLGDVPAVLLSGNHAEIARWRRQQALGRTWLRRPDLLAAMELSPSDEALLDAFRREQGDRGGPAGDTL